MATAIYSAITGKAVDNRVAMTGEISIRGKVKPVGGVPAKINAAKYAGATKVIIPKDNWQYLFGNIPEITIVAVSDLEAVLREALVKEKPQLKCEGTILQTGLSASPI